MMDQYCRKVLDDRKDGSLWVSFDCSRLPHNIKQLPELFRSRELLSSCFSYCIDCLYQFDCQRVSMVYHTWSTYFSGSGSISIRQQP